MSLTITIKVVPSAGKTGWRIDKSGQLKCFLKSPPEKGLANRELIKKIAKLVGVTQQEVAIVQGATSRKKLVRIGAPLTYEQFIALLGLSTQQRLF